MAGYCPICQKMTFRVFFALKYVKILNFCILYMSKLREGLLMPVMTSPVFFR